MRVTQIKQQQKNKQRYAIFLDDAYAFSVSERALVSSGLEIGNVYDAAELDALQQRLGFEKAYDKALDMLARRPRSNWEMHQYLERKDFAADVIEVVIEKLTERGYLDDAAFVRSWVTSRQLLKNSSTRRLRQELRAKRIPSDIIEAYFSDSDIDELSNLRELAQRKMQQSRYQDKTKLMQYLARQGFNYGDIKTVIDELFSSSPAS